LNSSSIPPHKTSHCNFSIKLVTPTEKGKRDMK